MTETGPPFQVPETALPVCDVAARCGVSERTVRRWDTRDGRSAVKVGHTFWITVSDLERFRPNGHGGDTLSVSVTAAPVRLADIRTRGHRDTEDPYRAALVRELTADNVRLSEAAGRLRAKLAQQRALPAPRETDTPPSDGTVPRLWWTALLGWRR